MPTETLRPSGVGATTDISNSTEATHWEAVDEVTADDGNSYVYQGSNGAKVDTYALPASVGSGTITSVTAYVRARQAWRPSSPGNTVRAVVRTGGTDYFGSLETLPHDGSWNTYSKEWTTNPNTGNPWTWAEIDALECGVEISRLASYPSCTQCYIVVTTPVLIAASGGSQAHIIS